MCMECLQHQFQAIWKGWEVTTFLVLPGERTDIVGMDSATPHPNAAYTMVCKKPEYPWVASSFFVAVAGDLSSSEKFRCKHYARLPGQPSAVDGGSQSRKPNLLRLTKESAIANDSSLTSETEAVLYQWVTPSTSLTVCTSATILSNFWHIHLAAWVSKEFSILPLAAKCLKFLKSVWKNVLLFGRPKWGRLRFCTCRQALYVPAWHPTNRTCDISFLEWYGPWEIKESSSLKWVWCTSKRGGRIAFASLAQWQKFRAFFLCCLISLQQIKKLAIKLPTHLFSF